MNIENITALATQLKELGFKNTDTALIKKISFQPVNFTLLVTQPELDRLVSFQIFLERNSKSDYEIKYYDVSLRPLYKEMTEPINGIEVSQLRTLMQKVHWIDAFDFSYGNNFTVTEKLDLEKEEAVENIINQLASLEQSDEGRAIANALKIEFWSDLPYHALFGNLQPVKSRFEITQRFYFSANHEGISANEAYRFLQNKLLEKEMAKPKKAAGDKSQPDSNDESPSSSGTGMIVKKKINGKKKVKKP